MLIQNSGSQHHWTDLSLKDIVHETVPPAGFLVIDNFLQVASLHGRGNGFSIGATPLAEIVSKNLLPVMSR